LSLLAESVRAAQQSSRDRSLALECLKKAQQIQNDFPSPLAYADGRERYDLDFWRPYRKLTSYPLILRLLGLIAYPSLHSLNPDREAWCWNCKHVLPVNGPPCANCHWIICMDCRISIADPCGCGYIPELIKKVERYLDY
jgi:hypothetical protein